MDPFTRMTVKSSPGREIPIDSIIITDRTRKDFGDINPLADSISSVRLLQPIVINENIELIDGQSRIKAYIQLGRKEIPCYQVNLKVGSYSDQEFSRKTGVSLPSED